MSSFIYNWKKKARDVTKINPFLLFFAKTPSYMFKWVLNSS